MTDRFDFDDDFFPIDPAQLDRPSLNYSNMSTETQNHQALHLIEETKGPRKSLSQSPLSYPPVDIQALPVEKELSIQQLD
jgi:hypothetical protein